MRLKILVCKECGEEIESDRLWQNSITVHGLKHNSKAGWDKPATVLRKKYFLEIFINVSDEIIEAPHYGTTTEYL